MGRCQNCNKEISLKNNETTCPNCRKNPYLCWNCNNIINCQQDNECTECHYFTCWECGCCSPNCKMDLVVSQIKTKYPLISFQNIKSIINIINITKEGKIHRNCEVRHVPISYAKGGKLKNMWRKLNGLKVKNYEDAEAFKKRFQKIIDLDLYSQWTINNLKEDGSHGIELREVSNLGICLGIAKKNIIIEKDGEGKILKEYELYEKVNESKCPHANTENLVHMQCKSCGVIYPKTYSHCENCIYKKGKRKGHKKILTEINSEVDFCQLPKRNFIQVRDKNIKRCDNIDRGN